MELCTRGEIQTVVRGVPRKETTSTDSKVVQTFLYRYPDACGCVGSQALTDVKEVPAGNDQQAILPHIRVTQCVQLRRIRGPIFEMLIVKNGSHGRDVVRGSSGSIEKK